MTNEELVVLIQGGERDKLPELWGQVERFVAVQARKRLILSGGLGGVEFGDLYNAGYLALVDSVNSFKPEAGWAFTTCLGFALKSAFTEAGGGRSYKQLQDPLRRAWSLDAPVGEDEGSHATRGELQPDPAAAQAFEDMERRIYREQLRAVLNDMLAALPEEESRVLRRMYYEGRTLEEIAAGDGADLKTIQRRQSGGLRALRRDWRKLAQFVEARTHSARSGERTAEAITMTREGLRERWTYKTASLRG